MLLVGEDKLVTGLKVQTIEDRRDTVGDAVRQAQVGRIDATESGDSLSRRLQPLVMTRIVHEHRRPLLGNVLGLLNEAVRYGPRRW